MVYKYQEPVIAGIETAVDKLEKMTEEHYRLHIGYRHSNDFAYPNIPVFVEVNGDFVFTQQTALDDCYDGYSKCEIYNYDRLELNKTVFLDLNGLLDKIIKDNRQRKQFYEKLNKELEAFNLALKEL